MGKNKARGVRMEDTTAGRVRLLRRSDVERFAAGYGIRGNKNVFLVWWSGEVSAIAVCDEIRRTGERFANHQGAEEKSMMEAMECLRDSIRIQCVSGEYGIGPEVIEK